MANIDTYLQAILDAVYGEDVRGSIHDAIELINDVGEVVLTLGTAVTSASSSVEGYYENSVYINTQTWDVWKCTGTAWTNAGNIKGDKGDTGNPGAAATIAVGSVTKGENASVVNSGTNTAAVFDFVLPKGDKGDTGPAGTYTEGTGIDITDSTISVDSDATPTENSQKPVKSGGVYSAIQDVYKVMGDNGATNLIDITKYQTYSGASANLTSNGIRIQCTNSTWSHVTIPINALKNRKYKIKGGASVTSGKAWIKVMVSTDNITFTALINREITDGIIDDEFDTQNYEYCRVELYCSTTASDGDVTYSSIKVTASSDIDSTYHPYVMTNAELMADRFYNVGDSITLGGNIAGVSDWYANFVAVLTASATSIFVTIPLVKAVKANGISLGSGFSFALRGPSDYIINYSLISNYNVEFIGFDDIGIELRIQKSDGTPISANDNNKVVSIAMKGVITFT